MINFMNLFSSLIPYKWLATLLIFLFSSLQGKPYETLFKLHHKIPRSSIKGIDGVYVINLDVRPEKWHRIEPILYYHGIDHVRFSAVFGIGFNLSTIKKFCARYFRPGALGCMLSHLSIYYDALQRGLKVIWVLEDDVKILRDPKVLTLIVDELNRLDPQWDILYTDLDFINSDGAYTRSLALPRDKKYPFSLPLEYYTYRENLSENIQLIRSRYGTASMIVSERGMKKVLDHFTLYDDILWPFDIEIHFVPEIRQYGIIDPVVTNANFSFNFSDTTIENKLVNVYEIDDEHVKYIEDRITFFEKLYQDWETMFPLSSSDKPDFES